MAASTTEAAGPVSPVSASERLGRAGPSTCSGVHGLPAREHDGLPTLQQAALLAGRNAERVGDRDVEAPGPVGLGDQVADRLCAVVDGERADLVVAAVDRVARLELDRLDRVGEAAEDAAQGGEEIAQPGGPWSRSGSSRPRRAKLFSIPGSPR